MFSMTSRRAFLVACLTLPLPIRAQVYRWVAADGSVHYGDRPVGDGAEVLDISSKASESPTGLRPGEVARLADISPRRDELAPSLEAKPKPTEVDTLADCERHTRDYTAVRERLREGYGLGEGTPLRRQLRAARRGMRENCP